MAAATPDLPAATAPPTPAPASGAGDPDALYEVIGEQAVEKQPMGAFGAQLAVLQGLHIEVLAQAQRLGQTMVEMLFDLRPAVDRQRRSDAAFVSRGRRPLEKRAPRSAAWAVVPDLAIEIVSPTNSANEVVTKLGECFQAGVRLIWVIDPSGSLVHIWDSPRGCRALRFGDDLDDGVVLPGLHLPLATLFAEERPSP